MLGWQSGMVPDSTLVSIRSTAVLCLGYCVYGYPEQIIEQVSFACWDDDWRNVAEDANRWTALSDKYIAFADLP